MSKKEKKSGKKKQKKSRKKKKTDVKLVEYIPAMRSVIIGHELGFDMMKPDFEELAGDNATRERQAAKIKAEITDLCSELSGELERHGRMETTDWDDKGEQIDVFDCYVMDWEFPNEEAARQASAAIREGYGSHGVHVTDVNADEDCQASFCVPSTLDTEIVESIRKHIDESSRKRKAELIESSPFEPVFGVASVLYRYQFESAGDVEAAFKSVRGRWDRSQVSFGWCRLSERMPEELEPANPRD